MPLTIQVFIPNNETEATLTAITGTGTAANPYTITPQGSSQFGTIEVADAANLLGSWQWKVGTRAIGRVLIVAGQTDYPIQSNQQSAAAAITAAGLALEETAQSILQDTGTTLPGLIAGIEGGGLTGDFTLTVTVTDADDSTPIENATVTLSRTGERGAEETNSSGVAVLGVDAATWSWVVRAAGYESRTGTVVVTGNQPLDVELDSIVVVPPTDPNTATLRVTCIGDDSLIDPGAVVRIRMIEAPAGQEGFGYDGTESTFTADGDGIAERLVIRGATYEIRREGTYKQWQKYVMPTNEDLILIDSFVQP
jgi:hypothetical protein